MIFSENLKYKQEEFHEVEMIITMSILEKFYIIATIDTKGFAFIYVSSLIFMTNSFTIVKRPTQIRRTDPTDPTDPIFKKIKNDSRYL